MVCAALDTPEHGSKTCNEVNMVVDTQCVFSCEGPLWKLDSGAEDTETLTCQKLADSSTEEADWDKRIPKCVRK